MARPRKTLPENGLAIIEQAAANGVSERRLAKALGMGLDAWLKIRRENPEARAAYAEAKAAEEDELVGTLMREARGAPAVFDENGKQIRAERPPYVPAAMFLLKTRHGYRENGPAEGADTGPRITINLPAAMSREDWARAVTIDNKES